MSTAPSAPVVEKQFPRFTFQPLQAYQRAPHGYKLLPFRFMRFDPSSYILVNECGEYIFLDPATFSAFVNHRLSADTSSYADLKTKHFLMTGRRRPCSTS